MKRLRLILENCDRVEPHGSKCSNLYAFLRRSAVTFILEMTILIVDDNPGIRRVLRLALMDTASTVWECSDGVDALKFYNDCQPDVVLMDVRMPILDGLTAAKQIRKAYPSAKVVIVTDYDDDDLRKAASEAGACGYSLKENLTELVPLLRLISGEVD